MKKKFALTLIAFVAVAAGVAGLSAFEAHVINVTAKIENALQVSADSIDFGTVFPQEELDKEVSISLSRSFLSEDRVDDVNYFIRQKPKCGLTNEDGTQLIGPTATGHVSLGPVDEIIIDCGPAPLDPAGQPFPGVWGVLPSLCEYISKEGEKDNDGTTPSFHEPWTIVNHQIVWLDTPGRLAKSENDTTDTWTIDLAVPCFGGNCAQDWSDFVESINPNALPADQWIQPIENEHKIYGCDLWIEVNGVSETSEPGPVRETVGANLTSYVAPDPSQCDVTVDDDGGNPTRDTIAEGLAVAQQGNTVCVEPGTYNENVPIEIVQMSLVGANPLTTTINGVVEIRANGVKVKGFTITGAPSTAPDYSGIYIWGNTLGHTISDNVLDGSDTAGSRGILFGYDVTGTTVMNNVIEDWLSGVYINPTSTSNLMFSSNDFLSNTVGIGSDSIENVTVANNNFDSNTAEAIGMSDAERTVSGVAINTNNFGPAGAGNNVNAYGTVGDGTPVDATGNWWDGEVESDRTNDTASVDTSSPEGSAFPHN